MLCYALLRFAMLCYALLCLCFAFAFVLFCFPLLCFPGFLRGLRAGDFRSRAQVYQVVARSCMSSARDWEHWTAPSVIGGALLSAEAAEFDPDTASIEIGAECFEDMILGLKFAGTLTATDASVLSFWAMKGGLQATESIRKIAKRPGLQSGAYSKRFDEVFGTAPKEQCFYDVPFPQKLRHEASRSVKLLPVLPLHEALATEFVESENLKSDLAQAISDDELPPSYWDHPVVTANPDKKVHPVCLYVDGVSFGRNNYDSVIAFWGYFLFSTTRHLLGVLRKTELCQCGCRGWCTLWAMWHVIAWGVRAIHSGFYPSERHDGQPWFDTDACRQPTANETLGFLACVLFVKSDWVETVVTIGMSSFKDSISPCPFCHATHSDFFDCAKLSPFSPAHPRKSKQSYERACNQCEIKVDLTSAEVTQLTSKLEYDKRKKGKRGRVLQDDWPAHNLQKGDRLEPCPSVPDIAAVGLRAVALALVFWRASKETSVRHRCPLFTDTGLGPDNLVTDWLHVLSLGVFQVWLAEFINDLFAANAWHVGLMDASSRREANFSLFKEQLWSWYTSEAKQGRQHTRVQKLLLGPMFGTDEKRTCDLYGGETNSMLAFSEVLLRTRGGVLQHARRDAHRIAGDSLREVLKLIRAHPRRFPDEAKLAFCTAVQRHLQSIDELVVARKPKHHFLIEMAGRTSRIKYHCSLRWRLL